MEVKLDMYPAYSEFEKLVGKDTAIRIIGLKNADELQTKHIPSLLEVMRNHVIVEQPVPAARGRPAGIRVITVLKPTCYCNLLHTPYMNGLEYCACRPTAPFGSGDGRYNLQLSLAHVIEADLKLPKLDKRALDMAAVFMKKYRTPYPALEIVFHGIGMLDICAGIASAYDEFIHRTDKQFFLSSRI